MVGNVCLLLLTFLYTKDCLRKSSRYEKLLPALLDLTGPVMPTFSLYRVTDDILDSLRIRVVSFVPIYQPGELIRDRAWGCGLGSGHVGSLCFSHSRVDALEVPKMDARIAIMS